MAFNNKFAKLLEAGEHQAAARSMVDAGMDHKAIRGYLDAIGFHPNGQWWAWVSQREAEKNATAILSRLF